MANLADAASLLGTSIVYDERTSRYHDLAQNYRMVSAERVAATAKGSMSRDGKPKGEYVPLDMFQAFQRDVYMFISNTASFAREAIVELRRSLASERRDTQDIRNEEFRVAEERSERGRETLQKIGSTISSGTRAVTGMGLGGTLLAGGTLAGLTMLSGMSNEDIQRIAKPIDDFIEMIDDIRKKISEYSGLLTAVGAGLLGLASAAAAWQMMRPPGGGGANRQAPQARGPRTQTPAPRGSGRAAAAAAVATGLGAAAAAAAAGAAAAGSATAPAPTTAPKPEVRPGYRTVETPSGTRYQSEETGRFVRASEATTPAGAPEKVASRNTLPRRMIRAGALGAVLSAIPDGIDAYRLIRERNAGELSEQEFKEQMVDLLGRSLGGMGGAAAGAAIGTLLGPVGSLIGSVAGGVAGSMYGPEVAQALFKSFLDESESPEDYFEQMAKGAELGANMETELSKRLAQLRGESRERTVATERGVNILQEAVDSGRITEEQAEQLRRQERLTPSTPEQILENIRRIQSASLGYSEAGIDPSRLQFTLGRDNLVGNIRVLDPIVQEVRQRAPEERAAPSSDPMDPAGIQTRNQDDSFGAAQGHAMTGNATDVGTRRGQGLRGNRNNSVGGY